MPPKRFSDFADEPPLLDGERLKIEELINREILILGYRVYNNGNNGSKLLTIQFRLGDSKHIAFTGSKVLREQIEKYGDEIPFLATIKKVDKYFTFS